MLKFSSQPIDTKLEELQRDAEERDAARRAKAEGMPYLNLNKEPIDRTAVEVLPEALAKEAKAVVFAKDKNRIKVGTYSSKTSELEKAKLLLDEKKLKAEIFIVSNRALENAWKHYAAIRAEDQGEIVSEITISQGVLASKGNIKTIDAATADLSSVDSETPTTEVLVKVLADAIVLRASDVHVEPARGATQLRYRIDGVLYDLTKFDEDITRRITGRLKLLANLKLNIKDEAQDGRFTIRRPGAQDVEVRLSVVPSEFGEAVVMRILDPSAVDIDITSLGLREDDMKIVKDTLRQPNGMVLATGPTGSGKTTSLYAFLKHNRSPEIKIITIEDPIEYHVEGIEQTQVRPKENYTFASGLRSILRQDPDIILVGEIRDAETASTAVDAALTGHLVFSTLHTNNASGAIPRLTDLKVKLASLASALKLVVAQRLVRKLCEKCRQPLSMDADMKANTQAFLGSLPGRIIPPKNIQLYKNVGCKDCINGFSGRLGVFELLPFGESVVEALGKDASELDVRRIARSQGMVYMQEDGVVKALSGQTTLEEVEKVTGPVIWPARKVE